MGLTVPDLTHTLTFFTEALGYEVIGEQPDYPAVFVSDGQVMITLWQAKEPNQAIPFDRFTNIGLHHLALWVPDMKSLNQLASELAERADTEIEFTPEPLGETGLQQMMCLIPGGVRVEFITAR